MLAGPGRAGRVLQLAVRLAAIVYLPLMYLHLTATGGVWATIVTPLWWAMWLPFAAELAVGIALSEDRRAYLRHHRLLLFTVCFGFPHFPYALRPIHGLGLLVAAGVFDLLEVNKLGKMMGILRREGPGWVLSAPVSVALAVAAFVLALSALGAVLDRTHSKAAPDPLRYLGSILDELLRRPSIEADALLVVAALVFALTVILSTRRSSARP